MDDEMRGKMRQLSLSLPPGNLPRWAADRRGMPNTIARSALFNARNHAEQRQQLSGHVIFSVGEATLTYDGEELRTDDEDVWLQLVHMARYLPLGRDLECHGHDILKAVGWAANGPSYDRLHACIRRLQVGNLVVTKGSSVIFAHHLIGGFETGRVSEDRLYRISIARQMVKLFSRNDYTFIDWAQSMALPTLPRKLHRLYSTHSAPYGAYKVETIRGLVGSKVGDLRKFRYALKKALDELVRVKFLASWSVGADDVVRVEKPAQK